jgi:ABC-2 type transport system permease protein
MMAFWNSFLAVYQRELRQDGGNPLAYVFVASFVSAAILLAFQVGGLFEAGRAELVAFFQFHPWLFVWRPYWRCRFRLLRLYWQNSWRLGPWRA